MLSLLENITGQLFSEYISAHISIADSFSLMGTQDTVAHTDRTAVPAGEAKHHRTASPDTDGGKTKAPEYAKAQPGRLGTMIDSHTHVDGGSIQDMGCCLLFIGAKAASGSSWL